MTRRLLKPQRKARACAHCIHSRPERKRRSCIALRAGSTTPLESKRAASAGGARPPKPNRKSGEAIWPDVVAGDFCGAFLRPEAKADRGQA